MKKVIIMGKGELVIRIANWFLQSKDFDLSAVVPVIPEPSWAPSLVSWAKSNNIQIISTGHYKDIPNVADEGWKVDLAFSVFYDKIIKNWFIQKCNRILNIHNSPLPKYRGVSPINWALKNKEREHGITIHEIMTGIDDGPIVAQLKYSIYPEFDEVIDVYNRANEYGWVLFQQTIAMLDKIKSQPQDDSKASYYSTEQNVLLKERRYLTKLESNEKIKDLN